MTFRLGSYLLTYSLLQALKDVFKKCRIITPGNKTRELLLQAESTLNRSSTYKSMTVVWADTVHKEKINYRTCFIHKVN